MTRALILLVAVVACRREPAVELKRTEFPGFALNVPAGLVTGALEYRDGQTTLQLGTKAFFVTWGFGTASNRDEIGVLARGIAAMLPNGTALVTQPARTVKVGGHDTQRVDGAIGEVVLSLVDAGCGARSVQIAMVSTKSVEPTFTAMLDSFECHPDPVQEKAVASVMPIAFDDPKELAGWSRVENPDAFAISDGESMLMFTDVPPETITSEMLERVITPMFGAMQGTWIGEGRETHDGRVFLLGVIKLGDETMSGAVAGITCEPFAHKALLALSMSTAERRPAAIAKLTKARCPGPGEKPADLPAMTLPK